MYVIIIKTLGITELPTLLFSCTDINIKSRVILELNVFFQLTTIQWRIQDSVADSRFPWVHQLPEGVH